MKLKPLIFLSTSLISFTAVCACTSNITPISDIQGKADISPYEGSTLTTSGVISAIVYPNTKNAGVFIRQTTPSSSGASSSLFVASNELAAKYQVGQILELTGKVIEKNQLTSLVDVQDIRDCGKSDSLTPISVSLPLSHDRSFEQLEGELIRFDAPLTVNDTYGLGRYGEITVADKRLMVATQIMQPGKEAYLLNQVQENKHLLVIDDASTKQNPYPVPYPTNGLTAQNTLRIGDKVSNVEGVLIQDKQGYKLIPTKALTFESSNPRPASPDAKPAKALRIASFNVLNYFNGEGQQQAFPTRRGASNEAEFKRQEAKLIAALSALDADIIGLLEVENNGYDEKGALASLTKALNKAVTKPYRFIITQEKPGSDAIKVALLYRPSAVSVEGKAAMLLAAPFDWGSRPPLAQSFKHLASNELVTVSINHFKSKGSCPEDKLSVNADKEDGQACWNTLRTQSSKALHDWLKTYPTGIKTDKKIILGDLNAYRMEDPVRALEALNWVFLSSTKGADYSYVYRGLTGSLDHALASPALAEKLVDFIHWPINADEPVLLDYNLEHKTEALQQMLFAPDAYRSSDHDPLIATFVF